MDKMFKSRKIASKDDKTICQTKNESLTSILGKPKMKDEDKGSTLNWSKLKKETSTVRRDKNRESLTSNLNKEKMNDEDKGPTLNWSKLNKESLTSNWDKFKTDSSTLTRDKFKMTSNLVMHLKRFIFCFVVGVACTLVGVYAFFQPEIEVIASTCVYAFGNVCSVASTMFVTGPRKQLERMCDKIRLLALMNMLMYFGLSLCATFLWRNFGLALLFCILQILSLSCYTLSHTQCFRKLRKLLGFVMK